MSFEVICPKFGLILAPLALPGINMKFAFSFSFPWLGAIQILVLPLVWALKMPCLEKPGQTRQVWTVQARKRRGMAPWVAIEVGTFLPTSHFVPSP